LYSALAVGNELMRTRFGGHCAFGITAQIITNLLRISVAGVHIAVALIQLGVTIADHADLAFSIVPFLVY
jgi:hypothetical protein